MKTLFQICAAGWFGTAILFGQQSGETVETKVDQIPAFQLAYDNLPQEKKEEFFQHKIKADQFFRQKRIFECLDEIYQANQIFDQDPGIWNLKGSCHVEFRDFGKARQAFRKAISINPENEGVMFNLAEMDFVTDQWQDCYDKFKSFTERLEKRDEMEGNVLALHRLAKFKMMLSLLKLEQEEEARELAKPYYDDFDDTPFTYYAKAALAYHAGNEEEANQWLGSAVRVFGGLEPLANWQDTLIEYGYIKSFYGDDNLEEIEIGE